MLERIIFKTDVPNQACLDYKVELPQGARFLAVQLQRGLAKAWWLCDPSKPLVQRRLVVLGTGILFTPSGAASYYLGTWQDAPYVWHLFSDEA